MNAVDDDILPAVRAQFQTAVPARLGIAVSGGGDSIALLHILNHCFESGEVELVAATVDHGLRPDVAAEIEVVAKLCQQLGVPHTVLTWDGWNGQGNLQDQARQARYQLLTDWAKAHEIAVLAVGHTADDQAETVLMHLARSAGVNGLSAMPRRRTLHGVTLLRPLLHLTRDRLRDYLIANDIAWSEDPTNSDPKYSRVQARQALQALVPLGLTADALAGVARNMAQAREALDWYSFLAARDIARIDGGDVVLNLRKFRTLPEEIARRLLVRALSWIGGDKYPPRRSAMNDLLLKIKRETSVTLAGCRVLQTGQEVWICREYQAVRRLRAEIGEIWDNRWRVHGGDAVGAEVRALGRRGLMLCESWRTTGRPHAALGASPAVWRGDELVAAPLAGMAAGWQAELIGGGEGFFASLLSH